MRTIYNNNNNNDDNDNSENKLNKFANKYAILIFITEFAYIEKQRYILCFRKIQIFGK